MATSSMLQKNYPGVYDHPGTKGERWAPVPEGLLHFLRAFGLPFGEIAMVFDLLQLRNLADLTDMTVQITDDKLAERLGVDDRNVRRWRQSLQGSGLVAVLPGAARTKGQRGSATTYDLSPLWVRYTSHRRRPAEQGLSAAEEGLSDSESDPESDQPTNDLDPSDQSAPPTTSIPEPSQPTPQQTEDAAEERWRAAKEKRWREAEEQDRRARETMARNEAEKRESLRRYPLR